MNPTTPSVQLPPVAMLDDRDRGLGQPPADRTQWLDFAPLRLVVALACRQQLSYDDPDRILDVVVDGVRCVLTIDRTAEGERLSPREREIVGLVARGYTNKMIATLLHISTWTVSTHIRRIFAKLGVSTRAAMVATVDNDGPPRAGQQRSASSLVRTASNV